MTRCEDAADTIRGLADDVGIHAWVHARPIGPSPTPEVWVDGHTAVPVASLYKLPLAVCWSDLVAGGLDPTSRLELRPEDRGPGPTGIATLADPVTLSQRDAVRLALTVSDNAAAEAVLGLVGLPAIARWCQARGLHWTSIRAGSATSLHRVIDEVGGRSLTEAMARLADPAHDRSTSEYDAALTSHSSPADLTAMLREVWETPHHGWIRASMAMQVWRHRIGSGFPHDDVAVAGKTGTLGRLRHEAAVVHFPGEHPVAVAVMTMSIRPETHQPRVDAAIGAIARAAVTALRIPSVPGPDR